MLVINFETWTEQQLLEMGIIKSIFLSPGINVKHLHAALLSLMHMPPDPEYVHFTSSGLCDKKLERVIAALFSVWPGHLLYRCAMLTELIR